MSNTGVIYHLLSRNGRFGRLKVRKVKINAGILHLLPPEGATVQSCTFKVDVKTKCRDCVSKPESKSSHVYLTQFSKIIRYNSYEQYKSPLRFFSGHKKVV